MYSQNRFADTRLIWTPHYHQQFALSLGKEHPYFFLSKFNPLNTDSRIFYGLLIIHINGLWLYLSFKDLYFWTVKFVSRLSILTLGREVCCGQFPDVQIIYYTYSRTPLFRSPKENGKKFEIAGFRNNRGSVKFVTMSHFLIKYSTVWRKTLIK